jgi:Xaa-Pro dipeptidase
MNKKEEIEVKLARVRKFLSQQGLDGLLLSSTANFAWLTAGGDDHVDGSNKQGVASLFVSPQKVYLITNNIEAPRMENEEVKDLGFEFAVSDWFDNEGEPGIIARLTHDLTVASDTFRPGMKWESSAISELRYELTPSEIERYRVLGIQSSLAVEKTARSIQPGMTEHEIAAEMARNLLAENMYPIVILIATDERNFKYRHPLPYDKKLDKYAMLITCARRGGLITSRTRSVYFGKLPSELEAKQKAVAYVDAVFMARTRPGEKVANVFQAAKEAYAKVGYPDEWRFHHQGGSIGYESRDYIGNQSSTEVVVPHQSFTWNPTIQGTKSEDTIILTDAAPEIITLTGQWPTMMVEIDGVNYERPEILVR